MSFYMCSKIDSRLTKCGPSHTTTFPCRFEADVPLGKILMLTLTLKQHFNLTRTEEPEPLPTEQVVVEDSDEPAACIDDADNEIPDQSTDPDDFPEVDMDHPLRVNFIVVFLLCGSQLSGWGLPEFELTLA